MEYILVSNDEVESPVEEELYEYSEERGEYFLSEDTEVDIWKQYYIAYEEDEDAEETGEVELYTLVDEEELEIDNPAEAFLYEYETLWTYVLTEDTLPVSETQYYAKTDDNTFTPVDFDDIENPAAEGLYVYVEGEGSYVLTKDVEFLLDKEYYMYVGDTIDNSYSGINYIALDFDEIENPAEEGLYVYNEDGFYELTEDTVPDPETQYYSPQPTIDEGTIEPIDDDGSEELSYDVQTANQELPTEDIFPEVSELDNYAIREVSFPDSPKSFGLYEYDSDSNTFILTQDETINYLKTYYTKLKTDEYDEITLPEGTEPCHYPAYELVQNEYVITDDEEIVEGKQYYVYNPLFPDYPEQTTNPYDMTRAIDPMEVIPLASDDD